MREGKHVACTHGWTPWPTHSLVRGGACGCVMGNDMCVTLLAGQPTCCEGCTARRAGARLECMADAALAEAAYMTGAAAAAAAVAAGGAPAAPAPALAAGDAEAGTALGTPVTAPQDGGPAIGVPAAVLKPEGPGDAQPDGGGAAQGE